MGSQFGTGGRVTERTTRWAAVAVGLSAAALTLANVVLLAFGHEALTNAQGDLFFDVISVIGTVLYVAIGLLIAVRARNVIGWFLAAVGISTGVVTLGNAYGAVGLVTFPGSLPAVEEVLTALSQFWIFALVGITLVLLLFPDGRPPSPRWRPVLWMGIGGAVASYVLFLLKPMPVAPSGTAGSFPNPFGVASLLGVVGPALVIAAWVTVEAVVFCFAGLIQRFRHGDAELRQQIKWLGLVAAAGGACVLSSLASLIACGCDETIVGVVAFTALILIILFGVPASIALALFKYRLYDLDLVVSKALVYGILAALFTLVYVALVIGVGTLVGDRGNSFLTIVTAVAIAVAFQPVRERVRHLANRIVYGKRATPYEVLSEFSDKVASAFAAEEVLPRMAQILATGTGASSARVWLRYGEELRPAASWPENGTVPVGVENEAPGGFGEREDGVEVRHLGELLGALSVTMPPSDPMNPSKERLVRDLAAQAGLVLRNVRLIEELRASRRRIVTAQDERAKQLERNLHDGAQQQLVALGVQLNLARRLAERDAPEMAATFEGLQAAATDALENLRDLARGIYPPLLADQGLVAALDAQARKAALPVEIEGEGIGRYPQEVEAAVYFCCLEALQNVAKYANASTARVRLADRDGTIAFGVVDDGAGFDPTRTQLGTGVQGMKDRLEALGGSLTVESSPGAGTKVSGWIPTRHLVPSADPSHASM